MPLSLWKPIIQCAPGLLMEKKKKQMKGGRGETTGSSADGKRQLQETTLRKALEEASEEGSLVYISQDIVDDPAGTERDLSVGSSSRRSLARPDAQKEFFRATSLAAERVFHSPSSIPGLQEAYSKFLTMYPKYKSSEKVDQLRANEYSHLCDPATAKVCLDYCGFGLFSYLQGFQNWDSSAFSLSEITANLCNHALYGGAEIGTAEHDVKSRIMDYLNIPENEYVMVFTVSRGSAFKLLSESYPFHTNKRLLTMFDHESQSVNLMAQSAREKGAKTDSAWFRWPTLKPFSTELRNLITKKKRKKRDASAAGLFVFPVQSRVTGSKYSYQWMALAQQSNWHVLLDAGSLGPKDMDSLGLSLFRPDFIVTSFYRVFGADPTGFGCLLIKKSVIGCLKTKDGGTGSGMVRIVPVYPQYLSDSMDRLEGQFGGFVDAVNEEEEEEERDEEDLVTLHQNHRGSQQLPAFSGAFTSAQVKHYERELDYDDNYSDKDEASTLFDETDSVSIGEVMRSPVFSDDESKDSNIFLIDVGRSPDGSDKSGQSNDPWFSKWPSSKQLSPRFPSKVSNSPIYDDHKMSFDDAVRSVSHDLDRVNEVSEEDSLENGNNDVMKQKPEGFVKSSEIKEDPVPPNSIAFELKKNNSSKRVIWHESVDGNGATSEIFHEDGSVSKESRIRRETEGEFRLLDRREGNSRFHGGRYMGEEENDRVSSMDGRVSLSVEDGSNNEHVERPSHNPDGGEASSSMPVDDVVSSTGDIDGENWRREPEIICRHLDHINMMGLSTTSLRLRYLINWLIASLLQLRFPEPDGGTGKPLVYIYGPKIKYERGAAVAFNVRDIRKEVISPDFVQSLAEKQGISLGVGFLSHIRVDGKQKQRHVVDLSDYSLCRPTYSGNDDFSGSLVRVEVLTASLGFLSSFDDVYKLWAFVAKFLDPSFVEGEMLFTEVEGSRTQK